MLGWRTPSVDAEAAAERIREAERRLEEKRQESVTARQNAQWAWRFCDIHVLLAGRFLMYSDREQAPTSGLTLHATVANFGPQTFDLRLIKMVAAEPPNLVHSARIGRTGVVKATNAAEFKRNLVLVQRLGSRTASILIWVLKL